jgi:hypothetical protein
MAKVKLNIRALSTTDKVAKARQIIKALTDNADFTTPQPPLAAIGTAAQSSKQPTAMCKPPGRPP